MREYEYLRAFKVPHSVGAFGACIVDPDKAPERLAKLCPSWKVSLAIVMPYIQGQTLREYLRARCVTLAPLLETRKNEPGDNGERREISAVLIPVARFCHELETRYRHYHGDIKMGNIMISPSGRETWVIDMAYASNFGVLPSMDPWSRGTPCYMAPEKVFFRDTPGNMAPENIPRSDCWSMGILAITLVLTSRKVATFDDRIVLDENDHFNPAITDTIFHLLDTTQPWFVCWMNLVGDRRDGLGYVKDFYAPAIIEQALKLVIFSGSLQEVFGTPSLGLRDDFLTSSLFSAINSQRSLLEGRRLYDDYLANTSHPYEMALITVKSVCMKQCPHVLLVIQGCLRWYPVARYSFEEVLSKLGWNVKSSDPVSDVNPVVPDLMDEVKGETAFLLLLGSARLSLNLSFSTDTSLEALLDFVSDPCATCKSKKARQMCPGTACRARTCSKECHAQHAHVPDVE